MNYNKTYIILSIAVLSSVYSLQLKAAISPDEKHETQSFSMPKLSIPFLNTSEDPYLDNLDVMLKNSETESLVQLMKREVREHPKHVYAILKAFVKKQPDLIASYLNILLIEFNDSIPEVPMNVSEDIHSSINELLIEIDEISKDWTKYKLIAERIPLDYRQNEIISEVVSLIDKYPKHALGILSIVINLNIIGYEALIAGTQESIVDSVSGVSTLVLAGVLAGAAVAASGGGGGGSSSVPADFETTEYNNQWGLGAINASTAYADGYSGSGITVAVIDTGVDLDHPDLIDNIASGGYDYVDSDSDANPSGQGDYMSHGTHVAGIIAGMKNGTGMHGVSYNANILALRAGISSGTLTTAAIISSIDRAINQSAEVINASFGGSSISTSLADKWLSAHNNDIITVHSAGNVSGSNPLYGALLPNVSGYTDLQDTLIAVVATDSSNVIASWSNECGVAKNWCLAAPGVSIYSTVDTTDTTDSDGDGYDTYNGTSMAAPHVSGAVAVLRSKWPSKTASQIVTILYDTATDLGASGIDTVYGRGLLNLGSALTASGSLSIPTSSNTNGNTVRLEDSSIIVSNAFGDAIDQQLEIAVLDKYQRDFYFSLNDLVRMQGYNFNNGFENFTAVKNYTSAVITEWGSLTFDSTEPHNGVYYKDGGIKLDSILYDIPSTIAYNYSPKLILSPLHNHELKGLHGIASVYNNPYLSQINNAYSMNIQEALSSDMNITFGALNGFMGEGNRYGVKGASLALSGSPYQGVELSSQYNMVHEEETFLGTKFNGAFETGSSETDSVDLTVMLDLLEDYSLVTQYAAGITKVDVLGDSLVDSVSKIKSDGYMVSLLGHDVFSKNDEFSLSFIQPLRVNSGSLLLNKPNGLNLDDTVKFDQQTLSLNPSGAEKNIRASYSFDLSRDLEITGLINYYNESGHNDMAPSYADAFIKLVSRF